MDRSNHWSIFDLRCEGISAPIGIGTLRPQLSWKAKGGNWREEYFGIKAATSLESLKSERPDLWDSGRKKLELPMLVYSGLALKPRQRVWFQVALFSGTEEILAESDPMSFEIGLITEDDWEPAAWMVAPASKAWLSITSTQYEPSPIFRRRFRLNGCVVSARLFIGALGLYELHINGVKIGDQELEPAFTHYNKRAFYQTYDVTAFLSDGDNTIGLMLGNGWFNSHTIDNKRFHDAAWRAAPGFRCRLEVCFKDNPEPLVLLSDETWECTRGPVTMDAIRNGEFYDARREIPQWDASVPSSSGVWHPAVQGNLPTDHWQSTQMAPIRMKEKLSPVKVETISSSSWLYDFGRHISGVAELSISGEPGTEIRLIYTERTKQFNPHFKSAGQSPTDNDVYILSGEFQTDRYTLKGDGVEIWRPRFTYHGFRFVKLECKGKITMMPVLEAVILHTDLQSRGEFTCSDPVLNKLQLLCRRSFLYNFHGFPTDCPTREKAGWTGDAHLSATQAFYNFDVLNAYRKWVGDLAETQNTDGRISTIAPTAGWGYQDVFCGPSWLNAFFIIPYLSRVFAGDNRLIENYYPQMLRLYKYYEQSFLSGKFKNMLGDWLRPYSDSYDSSDHELYNMAYFYQASRLLAKFSGIVGDNDEKNGLEAKCIDLRNDFNKLFFDPTKASYGKGSQSEISLALAFGLVPDKEIEAVIQNLLLEIERCDGHLDTGIQGTRFLLISLAKYGYIDKALAVLKKQGFPGFQWWLSHGATTLWERWNGTASLNHPVYSYISEIFYSAIAGIIPMDGESEYGWRKIHLRPGLNSGIRQLDCSCNSLLGTVKVAWEKKGNQYKLHGSLPDGCSATLRIPQGSNTEVRQHGQRIESIKSEKDLSGLYYGLYELTSGNFCSYITL